MKYIQAIYTNFLTGFVFRNGFFIGLIITAFVVSSYVLEKRQFEISFPAQNKLQFKRYKMDIVYNDSTIFASVLSHGDRILYKDIFNLQEKAKWKQADRRIAQLEDPVLLGYVLRDRYLSSSYRATKAELEKWVGEYSDHPKAYKIYRLLSKNKPDISSLSKLMRKDYLSGYGDNNGLSGDTRHYFTNRHWWHRRDAKSIWEKIHQNIRMGWVTKAHSLLKSEKAQQLLKPLEIDLLKWSLSSGYFAFGKDSHAYALVKESARRSGGDVPSINWTAGIAAWRIGKKTEATRYFSTLALAKNVSSWEKSSGAFWAYRGYSAQNKPEEARNMLLVAAAYPRTFYGILASRALKRDIKLSWQWNKLTEKDFAQIGGIPAIRRTLALVEIGKHDDAEDTLRKFYPKLSLFFKKKLVDLVRELRIPSLQVRMARMIAGKSNGYYDHSIYPIPPWMPYNGFRMEPALLLAFIRHESGFYNMAESEAGAKGLMQLMPDTFTFITRRHDLPLTKNQIYDPQHNMMVGQHYLEYLFSHRNVGGNLFFLLSAYNAGPGKLMRWQREIDYNDDPLLFIESIPSKETRNFIEQVMTNYWIYRNRFGMESPSIDSLLSGGWPMYQDILIQLSGENKPNIK